MEKLAKILLLLATLLVAGGLIGGFTAAVLGYVVAEEAAIIALALGVFLLIAAFAVAILFASEEE